MFEPAKAHRRPRFSSLPWIAAGALALLAANPVFAQTTGGYYQATLEQPAAPRQVISSDVLWYGHANMLEGPEVGDIAKRVCAVLAQKVGSVAEFSAGGAKLTADDMMYCNKHARKSK